MAVIEFINTPNETYAQMKRAINYIVNPKKTLSHLISGFNCDSENAYSNFVITKRIFDKETGRQYIHFTQAFSPDDKLTPELAHQIGNELLNSGYFDGFQVVYSTHLDRDHIHNHFIVNTVNLENGSKWHKSASDLAKLKDYSDELCLKYNLSVIANEPILINGNKRERLLNGHYKAIKEMRSWKHELTLAINECRYVSVNVDDFVSKMSRLGYMVDWDYSGELDDVKYTAAVIDTCKKHSVSIDHFSENLKTYGYDVSWKYILEISPKPGFIAPKERLIFDDLKSMENHIDSISSEMFNYTWNDDIQFLDTKGVCYNPDSFEQGSRFSPASMRFAFNINQLNGVKELPEVVKIPKDTLEYKKMVHAIKTCKQLSVNRDDFMDKLKSLGYSVSWDNEPSEKAVLKEVLKELKKSCKSLDEFIANLKDYGYSCSITNNQITIFDSSKGNDGFSFKKYDANFILKEFKDNKLKLDDLTKTFMKRYKIPEEQKRQLEIFLKRLEKLVDNNYVSYNNGEYTITDLGINASKQFSGFQFTSYDANVIFVYIDKANGSLSFDKLKSFLSKSYSDPVHLEMQYNYLVRRIKLNEAAGYLMSADGVNYSVTLKGEEEKKKSIDDFKSSKSNNNTYSSIKMNVKELEKSLVNLESSSEPKSLDVIKKELKSERKNITFESPTGIKMRNSSLYPSKQFTKKALDETFELNAAMKNIVDLSPSLDNKDLQFSAKLLGLKLEYSAQKRRYYLEVNENLKCYFTLENVERMKGIGKIQLPPMDEIFKSLLAEKIMYTTPEGKKCTSSQLHPYDKYSKEGMLKAFESNLQRLDDQIRNDRFELLLSAVSSLFKTNETPTRFPLSRIEGEAAKERAIEEAKGRGYDWTKKNDNEHYH